MLAFIALNKAFAQQTGTRDTARPSSPLIIGTASADRARMDYTGDDAQFSLIRSASGSWGFARDTARRFAWSWNSPSAELTWNSELPFSLNDGAQWAGRGVTLQASGGLRASYRSLRAMVWPTVWLAQNEAFPILPGVPGNRSHFSSPWHVGNTSIDLPTRFGNQRILAIDPGESGIWITTDKTSAGFSTESQWWGPGIRNALVLSNNAGGFPHLFVRTSAPVATRLGDWEGKWILGGLTESPYFDRDAANDLRAISGFVVTWSPWFQRTLTAGVTRLVMDDASGALDVLSHTFDPLLRWGADVNPRNVPDGAEQLAAAFARWVLPASNAEIYGEWSRMLLPVSLRELLVAPQFTQGFTIGLQWLPRVTPRSKLRLQMEMTNLEQSPESRAADTLTFYTSSVVPQGFTQRGQVLGAAIGPGSSSQWLAFDYMRSDHSLGLFVGRIRWDTDAYYTQQTSVSYVSYDASVFVGLRASRNVFQRALATEVTFQRRYNFLFQNDSYGYSRGDAFDKNNITVRLRAF